jgi:hypothetical protein
MDVRHPTRKNDKKGVLVQTFQYVNMESLSHLICLLMRCSKEGNYWGNDNNGNGKKGLVMNENSFKTIKGSCKLHFDFVGPLSLWSRMIDYIIFLEHII